MANHGCYECAQRISPAHAGLSLGEEDAPKSTRKARVLPEFGQRESLDSERITFTMFNL